MNDETDIIDLTGYSFEELKSIPDKQLRRALSRVSEAPEVPFTFQSSL
ncbi:hypothetical protein [Sphaerisporangium dianthi]|uniref:FXSXX-COOH protein n=1 Tax=Sphaerisporangium dianthi TaxID=1436120 RepID=A0ABV9CMP2_9ACTN